ncbi:MAG TPA: ABC transporter permease [Puia sp.]|nr:ABC transporter permease [Puia sp.]
MLKSYWLIAVRKLWKQKVYAAINVLGLAIGLTACLIIFLITHFELSYDRFHPNGDRIYRIVEHRTDGNHHGDDAAVQGPLASTLRGEVTGCQAVSPFLTFDWTVIIPGKGAGQQAKTFESPQGTSPVIITDAQYFRIFQYKWLAGNPATSLNEPFRVVLSAKEVRQYFGNIPPEASIGREVIYVGRDTLWTYVSGVVADWNHNSDFAFRDFISYSTAQNTFIRKTFILDNWQGLGTFSQGLVLLDKGVTVAQVERQFPAFVKRHFKLELGQTASLSLQPLADIHFNETYRDSYSRKAHLPTLYGLMGIAIFILILAVINFVNLSTAQSLQRTKEVGIRKVLGSRRKDLIFQFLGETFVLTILAVIGSLLITTPVINMLHYYMPPGFSFQPSFAVLLFLSAITIITTLLAGWYPAKVISALLPVLSLKGQATRSLQPNRFLHRSLIVFQFTISLLFIIGTVIVARQLHYVLNTDLGFDKDAIVSFNAGARIRDREALAQQLREVPGIALVSRNASTPQANFHGMASFIYQDQAVNSGSIDADTNYLRLFGLRLVAGRNFFANDSDNEYVINETLARQLGFRRPQEAIGQSVKLGNNRVSSDQVGRGRGNGKGTIVGVIRDFHSRSMHEAIEPIYLNYNRQVPFISIRLAPEARQPESVATVLAEVQKLWKATYPLDEFSYDFFDETIANLYQQEKRLSGLMRLAMIFAIVISCMGLLGLATFATEQRQKEISIRKIMGASVVRIFRMLTVDFLWPVVLAFVIAVPVAWYFLHKWLQGFAYRTTVPWWVFGCCGVAAVAIAMLTVGVEALKAAHRNPVKSLQTE